MATRFNKRSMFYLGLVIFAAAVIFLAYILYLGPHTKISETTTKVIYDHPNGPELSDIEPGDKLELNFESTKPVNVILMKKEDAGKYFTLEDFSVEHYDLAAGESTGGYFEHTFKSSGTWKVYFENPNPPPSTTPKVKYWGKIIKEDETPTSYYLNITTSVILMVLGLALVISSIRRPRNAERGKKN